MRFWACASGCVCAVSVSFAASAASALLSGCSVTVVNSSPDGGDDGGAVANALSDGQSPVVVVEAGGTDAGAGPTRDAAPVVEAGPFMPAMHSMWPQVPGNAKVVLNPMKLVTIVSSGDTMASQLFAFSDAMIASQWWTTITAEYGVGKPAAGVHVTGPAISTNPDQTAMLSYIQGAIASNQQAAPDGNTMYMLYLPAGIVAVDPMSGTNTDCQFFGGFHDRYDPMGDAFGVGQRCPTQGTGLTELEDLTITGSHEILEAATDPQPGKGWVLGAVDVTQPWLSPPTLTAPGGELADLCLGTQWTEGPYMYQRGWSNMAAAAGGDPCVPAMPSVPYYNTTAAMDWYTATSGASVDIPLTAYSTSASQNWVLEAMPLSMSPTGFTGTIKSSTTFAARGGMTFPTTNNGRTSTLTVVAPAAPSGSWAVFGIASVPTSSSAGEDGFHLLPVGIYIP